MTTHQISYALLNNRKTAAEIAQLASGAKFGTVFSEHMLVVEWTLQGGWQQPRISERKPFLIDPAASVLHYGQEIFEGMKAYRATDGRICLFRPDENAKRLNTSAQRMAMPELPVDLFVEWVKAFVGVEQSWVPEHGALYLRPFMFSDEAFLGVRPAERYIFCIIASPVTDYFKDSSKGISLLISTEFSRAARGGTGAAKCGGNYAASLAAQTQATELGCDQVLFTDAAQGKYIEELGGMNVFFARKDGVLLTPKLGTILPGITRNSILTIARDSGITVEETDIAVTEMLADITSGEITEAFACGTAATVVAIDRLHIDGKNYHIGQQGERPYSAIMLKALTETQKGQPTPWSSWCHIVTP